MGKETLQWRIKEQMPITKRQETQLIIKMKCKAILKDKILKSKDLYQQKSKELQIH